MAAAAVARGELGEARQMLESALRAVEHGGSVLKIVRSARE
jgi:hypothetical protein